MHAPGVEALIRLHTGMRFIMVGEANRDGLRDCRVLAAAPVHPHCREACFNALGVETGVVATELEG